MPDKITLTELNQAWDFLVASGFHRQILQKLKVISCDSTAGIAIIEMPVEEIHLNGYKTLHGGVIATLIDVCAFFANSVKAQYLEPAMSTDLTVSYLSTARLGDVVRVVTKCNKIGKTMSFNTSEIFANGKLIATGSHSKFAVERPKL
ncbi:HotDog domain-containing protein [Globomyces pollinis-pini]|nr:HotDog domain-containing protein [Globomyces pollinis-pini]